MDEAYSELHGRGMGNVLARQQTREKRQMKHRLDQVSYFLTSFSFLLLILPKDINYLLVSTDSHSSRSLGAGES